ncbi:MAG: DUF1194 domain-containing protein [Shimia sp.]
MRLILLLMLLARPVAACEVALLFAVDVSGSVDGREWRTQMGGLAEALRDPAIADALIREGAALSVLQWTGSRRQRVTLDWTRVADAAALEAVAARIADQPRVWRNFSTAIGEALDASADVMARAPECRRRVIDLSGDGASNEGAGPRKAHPRLRDLGVTVNALAIEGATAGDLTGYFFEHVITGPGAFVETADGYAAYPAAIRRKLLREVVEVTGRVRDHTRSGRDHVASKTAHLRQITARIPVAAR